MQSSNAAAEINVAGHSLQSMKFEKNLEKAQYCGRLITPPPKLLVDTQLVIYKRISIYLYHPRTKQQINGGVYPTGNPDAKILSIEFPNLKVYDWNDSLSEMVKKDNRFQLLFYIIDKDASDNEKVIHTISTSFFSIFEKPA